MKILILSWCDTKNPRAGGAEFITHQCAKYWVEKGNRVTLFTSSFPGCKTNETTDGVEIIRKGIEINVARWAFRYYRNYFRNRFDIIVDEINTVPFFTPLYTKEKKVAFKAAKNYTFDEHAKKLNKIIKQLFNRGQYR